MFILNKSSKKRLDVYIVLKNFSIPFCHCLWANRKIHLLKPLLNLHIKNYLKHNNIINFIRNQAKN